MSQLVFGLIWVFGGGALALIYQTAPPRIKNKVFFGCVGVVVAFLVWFAIWGKPLTR